MIFFIRRKRLALFLSALLILFYYSSAFAYDCSNLSPYVSGEFYQNGTIVHNAGAAFQCTVSGWCSTGGPYSPGIGWAAEDAWANLGYCDGTDGNFAAGGNDDEISSNTSHISSCPLWVAGKWYNTGDLVTYNGATYIAEHENPGYDPTISTWYWEPTSRGCGDSSDGDNDSNACPLWVAAKWYNAGDLVTYNGITYIAEHENPGYDPTISTWYWEPTSRGCDDSSDDDNDGDDNSGFHISEQQFNQLFPNRNSFYTYQGFVEAAKSFPAFAATGSVTTQKRELAAALANFEHETGDFVHITEVAEGEYCGDWGGADCSCRPGKRYYGRGPIQLSWNGNYCAAGKALGLDLVSYPEIVEQDSKVAWQTALWFWMTQSGAGNDSAHNAMVNGRGFGETIRTINGALECNGGNPAQVQSRIDNYKRITNVLGVTPGDNLGC